MRFSDLGLKMGDIMQLQISPDSDARYPVKLIGFLPDCSVIISAPVEKQKKVVFLREDQMVTLRFVVNNVASGFSAKVLVMRTSPSPYIHLAMPKQVEAVEVRSAVRVNCDIAATLTNQTQNTHPARVIVTNLSVLGGRFECREQLALVDDELSLTMTLELDDIQKVVTLDCRVNNKGKLVEQTGEDDVTAKQNAGSESSEPTQQELSSTQQSRKQQPEKNNSAKQETAKDDSGTYWYGFHFVFTDDEDRLLLKAYVYQEILRSLHLL